jgi:hypothetical protein
MPQNVADTNRTNDSIVSNINFRILRHIMEYDIVTLRLKAGIIEEQKTDTRQRRAKHVSEAKNQHATTEVLLQAVFSNRSAPRLYNEQLGFRAPGI